MPQTAHDASLGPSPWAASHALAHAHPHTHASPRRSFPQRFGRFILLAPIAAGGMAEVFVAELTGPHGFSRRVALKRIHAHLAQEPGFIQSFLDEARLGACLRHPHVVQIQDLELIQDVPVAAMEYVEGGHFGSLIARGRALSQPIPVPFVVELILQVARGLEHAHGARDPSGRPLHLIHRDLKPSNLLLGFEGSARIVDFGIARASINLTQTAPDVIKGSVPYMAPEQASGETLSCASDLFSLGAVFYEMLTLERLHQGQTQAALLLRAALGPSPEALSRLETLPLEALALAPILRKLLAPVPGDRFATASALITALEETGHTPLSPARLARLAHEWLSSVSPPKLPSPEQLQAFRAGLELGAIHQPTQAAPAERTGAAPPDQSLAAPGPLTALLESVVLESGVQPHDQPAPALASAVELTLAEARAVSESVPGAVPGSAVPDEKGGGLRSSAATPEMPDPAGGLTATPLLLVKPSRSGLDVPIHTGQTSPTAEPWGTAPVPLAPEDITGPPIELVPGRLPEAVTPEAVTPEAVTPEAVTPEAVTPEGSQQSLQGQSDEAPVSSQVLLFPGVRTGTPTGRRRSSHVPAAAGLEPTSSPLTESAPGPQPSRAWVRPVLALAITLGLLVWGGTQVWRLAVPSSQSEEQTWGWVYVLEPASAQVWLESGSDEGVGGAPDPSAARSLGSVPLRFLPPPQARIQLRLESPGKQEQRLVLRRQRTSQVVMAAGVAGLEVHTLAPEPQTLKGGP